MNNSSYRNLWKHIVKEHDTFTEQHVAPGRQWQSVLTKTCRTNAGWQITRNSSAGFYRIAKVCDKAKAVLHRHAILIGKGICTHQAEANMVTAAA
jgi:hypothetical protein